MAIYTLGTLKSTPVEWHKLNSLVKGTEQMIKTTSFNFFARNIVRKRRDTKIQDLLAARGLCQYSKMKAPSVAHFYNLKLTKEEAIGRTNQLISSQSPVKTSALIYTDGSWEKGGAWAAIYLEADIALSLALGVNPHILNHECEAVGVLLALQLLHWRVQQSPYASAFILTDNRGVLQRLKDCHQAKTDMEFNFVWCPGHVGIRGNEAPDLLAKEATNQNSDPDRTLPASSAQKISTFQLAFHFRQVTLPSTTIFSRPNNNWIQCVPSAVVGRQQFTSLTSAPSTTIHNENSQGSQP
ncbi:hypothetical protein VP01_1993g2 [Puccinia sorghi]|uniref:Uncharacterized protein n=1 Tax=Puccinia sorghi TaxID=27349 RepID=A0A0L6VC40_9BASI|nr:hypothetical protein VP01_1993g2 [Puccinia sorghi]